MLSIYENNLIALASIDKDLEQQLRAIKTNELYEVFLPDNEPLENVKIIDINNQTTVNHTPEELAEKLQQFEEYDNYHSLYFFGIGTGVFFQKLLNNKNHQKIYIFEPEIELIYIVLNLIDFSSEIVKKRLIIKQSTTVNIYQAKTSISSVSRLYLKKYNLDIYSKYYDKYMQEIKRLNSVILLIFKHELQDKGDSLDDTLVGYKHSLEKMFYMFKQPSMLQVINSVKKRKHAIIVSTGPSLEKQLPILKKYQDYFTILCVDASFPILYREGIRPDIVLAMERVPEVANFFVDVPEEFYKDIVFMLATVCHDDAFNAIKKGAIICPYLRADTHNMSLELNDWGYLGGGLCGANYIFNFAINADFDNFIFIGQDLAFSKDGSSHASGHVFGTDGEKYDETFDGYITAYGGEGKVATQKYWKLFLNDFIVQISYAKKYKEMQVYNATEGGARIDGTIEMAFEKYCYEILDIENKKIPIKLDFPTQEEIKKNTMMYMNKQHENLKLAKSVYKQANKAFIYVESFLEKIQKLDTNGAIKTINDREIYMVLDKIYKVRNKYAEQKFINSFSSFFMSYLSHLDFDIAAVKTMRENTPEAIKLKKINYIKINYEWLYRLAGSLKKNIEIIEESFLKKDII